MQINHYRWNSYSATRYDYEDFGYGKKPLYCEKDLKKTNVFSSPNIVKYVVDIKSNYNKFFFQLKEGRSVCKFTYKSKGEEHIIFVGRGFIYKNNKLILMATIEEEVVVVRIDSDFTFDPLWRRFQKEMFPYFKNLNIDVIITSNIKEQIFNIPYPKFKSLSQLNANLKRLEKLL